MLLELGEYGHDVLYPLASQQIAIDLDDGVKVNYPRFYPALKKITGLEAANGESLGAAREPNGSCSRVPQR